MSHRKKYLVPFLAAATLAVAVSPTPSSKPKKASPKKPAVKKAPKKPAAPKLPPLQQQRDFAAEVETDAALTVSPSVATVNTDAANLKTANKIDGVAPADLPDRIGQITTLLGTAATDKAALPALGAEKTKLEKAFADYKDLSPAQTKKLLAGTQAALKKYPTVDKTLSDLATGVANATSGVTAAAKGSESVVNAAYTGIGSLLKNLKAADARDPAEAVLLDPTVDVDDLRQANALLAQLDPLIAPYQKALTPFEPNFVPTAGTTAPDLLRLNSRLRLWIDGLTGSTLAKASGADTGVHALEADPSNGVAALAQAREATDFEGQINVVVGKLPTLFSQIQSTTTPKRVLPVGFDLADLQQSITSLKVATNRLDVEIGLLEAAPPVNQDTWDSQRIDLYYIDDVPRLIRMLSPSLAAQVGGDGSYQAKAEAARQQVDSAGQDVASAEAKVNDTRAAVDEARNALQAAQREAESKKADLARITRTQTKKEHASAAEVRRLQEKATLAQNRYDLAQNRVTELTNGGASAADIQRAEAERDAASAQLSAAQAQLQTAQGVQLDATSDATAAATAANQDVQDLQSKVSALDDARKQAESALTTSTQDLRTKMAAAYVAAQADNLAFAQARDATGPIWESVPTGDDLLKSTDPIRRVVLFGEPNGKTLFVRGARRDIDLVKRMIAVLDRPEAQSEMSVYSVEISSQADAAGTREAGIAMQIVDDELTIEKTQVQASLRLLRGLIDEKVESMCDAEFTGSDFPFLCGLTTPKLRKTLRFYDPALLEEIGLRVSQRPCDDRSERYLPLLSVVPRASGTTTLAEALVALSLARPDLRREIICRFKAEVNSVIRKQICNDASITSLTKDFYNRNPLGAPATFPDGTAFRAVYPEQKLGGKLFSNLIGFFEPDGDFTKVLKGSETSAALSGFQAELVTELRARVSDAYVGQINRRFDEASAFVDAYGPQVRQLWQLRDRQPEPLIFKKNSGKYVADDDQAPPSSVGLATSDLAASKQKTLQDADKAVHSIQDEQDKVIDRLTRLLDLVVESYGLDPNDYDTLIQTMTAAAAIKGIPRDWEDRIAGQSGVVASLVAALNAVPRPNWYEARHAHLAKLNENLTSMLKAFDSDVREDFAEPMIRRLRDRLLARNLSVGVFQRTSVVASNRLVARVDPQASAQIGPAKEIDVLQDALQLAQLYASAQTGGLIGVLGKSAELPKNGQSGLYAITTGNLFQITPIFDPTGQVMRFKFDYVLQSQVREPDGSVDPQLSKIERHGINTEVRLGDYEIERISQFNTNSQVGIPTRKTGGLPLFKDLYPFSEIPLVGWFTYRHGHGGQIAQSLVLASTSMYPTIQDVIEILANDDEAEISGDEH